MQTIKIEEFPESGFARLSMTENGTNPISLFDVTFSYGITAEQKERQVTILKQIVTEYNGKRLDIAVGEMQITNLKNSSPTKRN